MYAAKTLYGFEWHLLSVQAEAALSPRRRHTEGLAFLGNGRSAIHGDSTGSRNRKSLLECLDLAFCVFLDHLADSPQTARGVGGSKQQIGPMNARCPAAQPPPGPHACRSPRQVERQARERRARAGARVCVRTHTNVCVRVPKRTRAQARKKGKPPNYQTGQWHACSFWALLPWDSNGHQNPSLNKPETHPKPTLNQPK